jgi:acyl dehydratase
VLAALRAGCARAFHVAYVIGIKSHGHLVVPSLVRVHVATKKVVCKSDASHVTSSHQMLSFAIVLDANHICSDGIFVKRVIGGNRRHINHLKV